MLIGITANKKKNAQRKYSRGCVLETHHIWIQGSVVLKWKSFYFQCSQERKPRIKKRNVLLICTLLHAIFCACCMYLPINYVSNRRNETLHLGYSCLKWSLWEWYFSSTFPKVSHHQHYLLCSVDHSLLYIPKWNQLPPWCFNCNWLSWCG